MVKVKSCTGVYDVCFLIDERFDFFNDFLKLRSFDGNKDLFTLCCDCLDFLLDILQLNFQIY